MVWFTRWAIVQGMLALRAPPAFSNSCKMPLAPRIWLMVETDRQYERAMQEGMGEQQFTDIIQIKAAENL